MLKYDTTGKIRNKPLSSEYTQKLTDIVAAIDPNLGITVVSAGQDAKGLGTRRTGSTRHDVDEHGVGHTADIYLTRGGMQILPGNEPELYAQLIEAAAPHFPGIGHYKWGLHIGGGNEAFWGPTKSADSADPEFLAAFQRGRARASNPDTPLPESHPEHTPVALRSASKFRFGAPRYRTRSEELAAQRAQEAETPGVLEGAGLAADTQWIGFGLLDHAERSQAFKPDPNFTMTEDLWAEITTELPHDYWSMFDDAYSADHARDLARRANEIYDAERRLGLMGTPGILLTMGAAVTDPVGLVAGAASGGAGYAAAVSRTARALRTGVAVGATNAALETGLSEFNPSITASDILVAGLFGTAVGGAAGALTRSQMDDAIATQSRSMLREVLPEGSQQSIGAARATADEVAGLTAAQERALAAEGAPRTAFGALRVDMVGKGKSSNHPLIRKLTGLMAEDGVGNIDDTPLARGATENIHRDMKQTMAGLYRMAEPQYRDWVRANNLNWWQSKTHRGDFYEQVGMAIRRPAGEFTDNAQVNKVADHMRKELDRLRRFAQEKGVAGFDEIGENPQYLMRRFNHRAIDDLVAKHGENTIVRVISNAIENLTDELDVEDVQLIAKQYFDRIRSSRFDAQGLARVFDKGQAEQLRDMLQAGGEISPERINRIVNAVNKETSIRHPRAKQRLRLDETYRDRATGIAFEDLLDNNAERLFTTYARQIMGQGYMQDVMSNFTIPRTRADGVIDDTPPSWETVIENIRATAGEYDMKRGELNDMIERLETLRKAVLGIPLGKDNRAGHALRILRDYNFIRIMNQVGFAQLAEIGNILGQTGLRATMQQVPALRRIWSRAADGTMSDELLDEIEVIWGLGTDRLRNTFTNRMDDYGAFEARQIGQVENLLDHGKRITADISLMAPVNMALQRMAGRAAVQRFMNMAAGNKTMSKKRLATLGLSPEDAERIYAQMNKHVTFQEGMLGRKVRRINIDEWDDQEIASKFIDGVDKWTRRIIQEQDVGLMSQWMTTDVGKTLTQFRSFMIGAWAKQTLYGAHVRDFDQFAAFMSSMFFGALSYTAQTYINSLGKDDPQAYRDERFAPDKMAASAFQRAGFSSFFPGAADTMLYAAGFEPVFAYGRSTGLPSNIIAGNPTVDLLTGQIPRAVRGIGTTLQGQGTTAADARALSGILPFQNAMGIRNALNAITADLPGSR